GVEAVALANRVPGLGTPLWTVTIEGDSYESPRDHPVARGNIVTSGFFDAMGIELLQGRDFLPSEVWDESAAVAIVNQSFVSRVLGGREPLGMRVRIEGQDSPYSHASIIGVVEDTYIGGGVGGLGNDDLEPQMVYVGPAARDVRSMSAILATTGQPASLAPELRRVVADLDADLPVYRLGPLSEAIRDSTWAFDVFGSLCTIFGIAALFLATVGLYGVMAFSVNQRRREMGVRMALGAAPGSIRGMVLGLGVRQLAVGMLLGVGLGYALGGPLDAVTFDVDTNDLSVYAAIVTTLGLTGLLATIIPAFSATRTDPVEAMRM
ncbi:MAG: ABC transporter permease, partial [Gemmatimonadota bacterium]